MDHAWSSTTQVASHRQRSRKACQPCRQRKRKCNGHRPCHTCTRYDYDCYYSKSERFGRERRPDASQEAASPSLSSGSSSSRFDFQVPKQPRHRNMLVDIPSRSSPSDFQVNDPFSSGSFAWNLDLRPEPRVEEVDFTHYLSWNEFQRLSEVFFNTIHSVIKVLDRNSFRDRAQARYGPRWTDRKIDPLICGVAALGSFFSIGTLQSSHQHEAELVELAKSFLDHSSLTSTVSEDDVVAWVLRTIYLRATAKPVAAWLSSCTALHIIDTMDMETPIKTQPSISAHPDDPMHDTSELKASCLGIAKSLNSIISFECGKRSVALSSVRADCHPADSAEQTPTEYIITLGHIVLSIESNPPELPISLTTALTTLSTMPSPADPEIDLLKASLALTMYRRIRSSGAPLTHSITSTLLSVVFPALSAALAMSRARRPWWPLASVPLQTLSVLLVTDTSECLARVPECLRALEAIETCWQGVGQESKGSSPANITGEALTMANWLVEACRRRKVHEARLLARASDILWGRQLTTADVEPGGQSMSTSLDMSHESAEEDINAMLLHDYDDGEHEHDALADAESGLNGYLERPLTDVTVSPEVLQLPSPEILHLPSPVSPTTSLKAGLPGRGSGEDLDMGSRMLYGVKAEHGVVAVGQQQREEENVPTIDWDRIFGMMG